MFSFLKKKEDAVILGSPIKGKAVSLSEVSDPTFSSGMLGKGSAVIPSEGKVFAPCDGEVGMVFDTLHAISMTAQNGAEILMHIGLDTVQMKGEGFQAYVKAGDQVKKGDLLLTMDIDKIKEAGYDPISPIIICNTDEYKDVQQVVLVDVEAGDDLIKILK